MRNLSEITASLREALGVNVGILILSPPAQPLLALTFSYASCNWGSESRLCHKECSGVGFI